MLAERGRKWAYTTVATLLQRLQSKEYVTADSSVVPHVYQAVVTRDELLDRRLKDAAAELCDGRAAPLILALVQGNRFSAEELARFRRLLDDAAMGRTPGSQNRSRERAARLDRRIHRNKWEVAHALVVRGDNTDRGGCSPGWPPWREGCAGSGRRPGISCGWWC